MRVSKAYIVMICSFILALSCSELGIETSADHRKNKREHCAVLAKCALMIAIDEQLSAQCRAENDPNVTCIPPLAEEMRLPLTIACAHGAVEEPADSCLE